MSGPLQVTGLLTLNVRRLDEVLWVKQEVQRFLAEEPFDAADRARLEVVTGELATNMVKHAGGGMLVVERVERDGRRGVRFTARDEGPGIPDLAAAMRPGFSTTGTYGYGLPAVQEFMDKVAITSAPGAGTRVEAEKWHP